MPPRHARRSLVTRIPAAGSNRQSAGSGTVRETPARPGGDNPLTGARNYLGSIQAPTGYQHVLMGEMVVAFLIIGVRAVADYVPAADLHSPGTEAPKKGASPVVLITATLGVFFVLSFLATRGGWAARTAAAFGLLMIVALMINSEGELVQVASWVENIGANNQSQTAQQAGTPPPAGSGGGSSGGTSHTSNGLPWVSTPGPYVQNPGAPIS